MVEALVDLTGRIPAIFEPRNPMDTGGLGYVGMTAGTGLGMNVAGGLGSMALPFQFFVTAYRPVGGGVANIMGLYNGSGWAGGGLGSGAIELASFSMVQGSVTDQAILDCINSSRPVATIAWTKIES